MLFLLILLWISVASAEVITLSTKDSITCVVTGDTTKSTIYLSPPTKSGFIKHTPEIDTWIKDDWEIKKTDNANLGTVTDQRWQDFPILGIDEDVGHALETTNSIPFSVCVRKYFYFDVLPQDYSDQRALKFQPESKNDHNRCRWEHYTLRKQNNSLLVYSEDTIIKEYQLDFDPYWIYLKSPDQNYTIWKLHNYSFREATTPTKIEEERSVISVNFTDNLCVSMYATVDDNSFLKVNIKSGGIEKEEYLVGFNKKGSFKKWKQLQIQAPTSGVAEISFSRGLTNQGDESGYWAIDEIGFCKKNLEVYKVSLQNEASDLYICEALDDPKPDQHDNVLSCNIPGYFGRNCSISCESVLGPTQDYCQRHRICKDASSCFCSWGYHGDDCNRKCPRGTWNLFCSSQCKPECKNNCDTITGDCPSVLPKPESLILDLEVEEVTEDDLPFDVTLISDQLEIVFLNFDEESDRTISYTLLYFCSNLWCGSRPFKEETILRKTSEKAVIHTVDNLNPFTTYEIVLKVDNLQKRFNVKRKEPRFDLKNFVVYSSNSDSLSVRFSPPETESVDFSVYKLWYSKKYSNSSPNYISAFSQCKLWSDCICGKIDNLNSNGDYSVIVEATKGLSQIIRSQTREKEPEEPKDLRVLRVSNGTATIGWDHPSIPNGHVQKFVLQVENHNGSKNYSLDIEDPQKSYQYQIPVHYNFEYNISVRACNRYKGAISRITATFIPIDPKFCPHEEVLVEICSERCCWSIPRPRYIKNKSDYKVLQIPDLTNKDVSLKKYRTFLKDKTEFLKSRNTGFGEFEISSSNEDHFLVELGNNSEANFLFRNNKRNFLYLVLLQSSEIRPISFSNESEIITALNLIIIIATFIILAVTVLLFLAIFRLKRKFVSSSNGQKTTHEMEQIEEILLFDNTTHIESSIVGLNSIESYLKNAILKGKQLTIEFRSVPSVPRPMLQAFQEKNYNKNKDTQNIPYDHNRVILKKLEGMGTDDYINASYINGFDREKLYIATQGPKFVTVRDFWRMIWQEQVETVLMATNFVENQIRKCAEYFPQYLGAIFECENMSITLLTEEIYEHYHLRYLEVKYGNQVRTLRHFFLKWHPDALTPMYPNFFVPLVKRLCAIRENSNTPILIHCSSGVNRTGTLILCDLALQMAKTTKGIDFFSLFKNLRDQRPNMISSEKQYILAHLIVLECLMDEENVFKKSMRDNFDHVIFENQLNFLERLSWHDEVVESWSRSSKINTQLCYTDSYLVDGYEKPRKFLTTKLPTKNALNAFWGMVVSQNISIILLLNKQKFSMWPCQIAQNDVVIAVKEQGLLKTTYCSSRELLVVVFKRPHNCVTFKKRVYLFEVNHNSTLEFMIKTLDEINKDFQEERTLIACQDGITNCGAFVTLDYIIEKCKREFEADICTAIRTVRRSGASFIKTPGELEFLYRLVVQYLQKYDQYSNIL